MDSVKSFSGSLGAHPLTLALVAGSALMLLLEERRLSLLALLLQYLLLGLLVGPRLYPPMALVRVGLGVAACLVLYITAGHVQGELRASPRPDREEERIWLSRVAPSVRVGQPSGTSAAFRLALVFLGGLTAYGLWHSHPVPDVPAEMNLTTYWLMSLGLLMAITATEPLRMGFGLLTFINGFESTYLFLEQSLLVITLLGIVDLIACLGIAACAESRLESLRREASD